MPGIYLYSSNRLELLADSLAQLVQSNPLPPIQKETVLVQSRGMARWLAMETATRMKIWANNDCPFPNTFIRNIYKLLLPDIPDTSSYEKRYIIWQLMEILPEFIHNTHFTKVASYLESGDDLKLYQLAYELADLFDQYTLFRPRMIINWEDNTKEIPAAHTWQAMVWRMLVERIRQNQHFPEFHRARLLQLFEEKIHVPDFDHTILPPRVSIFGISSLPPYHTKVLAALAHHIDLHFFIMNPCMEYWFDIIADLNIVKISRKESASQETLHLKQGNSLLASMGHLGRDFLAMLQDFILQDHDFFVDPGGDSLLANIQQDILFLRESPDASLQSSPEKKKINHIDTSLVFHSCHSPMREIETLYDQLLEIFAKSGHDAAIEPKDILVMAPEIEVYTPLIRAVFDMDNSLQKKIPYSISDQSFRKSSTYIETFLDILLLPQSRLSSIDVLKILEAKAVQNRFSFNNKDFRIIKNWIHETLICWGVDQDHKAKLQLPPYKENTWIAGLDRLLLGYAMPGHDQILFDNILPYDHIEGNNTNTLGNFLDFCDNIFSIAEILRQHYTLTEWSDILLEAKNKLLLAEDTFEAEDRTLHHLIYELKLVQSRTGFNKKVSLRSIRSFLIRSLDERFSSISGVAGFLTGGVTFCSMLPMRAIPFKVICLLGMNDGQYPRSGRKNSFDLLALEPKRGDRSRRYDDRYLFLESLLSARQKLSISFVGQSIQDSTQRPPSVLVSELMDYIDQGYEQRGNTDEPLTPLSKKLTTVHHLQPFHPDYFKSQTNTQQEKLFSYSADNYEAAIALISNQHAITSSFVTLFADPPPDEFKHVELHKLVRYFSHPARYFLVEIFGIAPIEEPLTFDSNEPFTLKVLARHKLENEILEQLIQGQDIMKLYQIKKASGELPHGKTGENLFMGLVSELQSFHNALTELFNEQDFTQQQINLTIGDYTLSGQLDTVSASEMVQYRYATLKPKDVIRSWISHLVLNSVQGSAAPESGVITYYAGKEAIYKYRPPTDSQRLLEKLLDLYWQGLTKPLYFFPRSSFVFAQEIYKGKNEQEALRKANIEWEGNDFNKIGEKNDPYNLFCYKNMELSNPQFIEQAKDVFLPAMAHQKKYNSHVLQPGSRSR